MTKPIPDKAEVALVIERLRKHRDKTAKPTDAAT